MFMLFKFITDTTVNDNVMWNCIEGKSFDSIFCHFDGHAVTGR